MDNVHRKVAFIGNVGSGKTTIINILSSIETVNTDVESSLDIGKRFTTVGIDFGYIKLSDDMSIGLYGVPGQRRFSFIWDFVKEGLWAVVLLIRDGDQESLDEIQHLIEYFEINEKSTCVIGITHAKDTEDSTFSQKVRNVIKSYQLNFPIYHIDARQKESALLMMNTLIAIKETE